MSDAKLEIRLGTVSFSGEGPGEWLAKQLDKVLAKLPELAAIQGGGPILDLNKASEGGSIEAKATKPTAQKSTLAAFLKDKKAATGNQQRKFLAAAAWLQDGGTNRLSTGDVTKALSDHNQGKLGNAAQCLINLAKQGWIVREAKQFYVSEEGRTELNK